MNRTIIEPYGPKLVKFKDLPISSFFILPDNVGGAGRGKLFFKVSNLLINNSMWMDSFEKIATYGDDCSINSDTEVISVDVTISARVR